MDPGDGYVQALKILEERYGNNYEISRKWIQRIINRPNLKGPSELRDFADDLKCCYQTLKNMGHEKELDNAASLQAIWRKLPQYLQDRWSHENHIIKKDQKRVPKLKDLVDFIIDGAEEANDPIFSRVSFSELRRDKEISHKGAEKRRIGSFAVKASSVNKRSVTSENRTQNSDGCPCCGQEHYMTQCLRFKAMKIKDRRNFVMSKALCINCFAKGHIGKTCPRSFVCNISGCGLKHKFLHMPTRLQVGYVDNTGNSIPVSDQNISTTSSSITTKQSSHYVRTCGGKLAIPIVPARVWHPGSDVYIDTYAMLDPGSNATY